MRYDHVIWDWNGTLLDDAALVAEIMRDMLRRRALGPFDLQRHRELFTHPVSDYYRDAGFDFDLEPFERLTVEFHELYLRRWRECSLTLDAETVVSALSGRRVTQSILSAGQQQMIDEGAAHFGLTERMFAVLGLDDFHAESKVDRGRSLVSRLPAPAERVLLVGDTGHDHEVATAIGVDVALIERGHATRERLEATGAPLFGSLRELLAWMT